MRQRRLVMPKGTRLAPADVGGFGKHVVLGAEEVLGFRHPGERRVDLEVFANRYPNARLTEPGDVLVAMNPRPGAMIDHDGYSIAEYPVRILRIPGRRRNSSLRGCSRRCCSPAGQADAPRVRSAWRIA